MQPSDTQGSTGLPGRYTLRTFLTFEYSSSKNKIELFKSRHSSSLDLDYRTDYSTEITPERTTVEIVKRLTSR